MKFQQIRQFFGSLLLGKSYQGAFNQVFDSGGSPDKMSKPFAESVWVMRAIKEVAGPIAKIGMEYTTDNTSGEQSHEDPELDAWWRNPAVGLNYYDFIEASVGWLKLAGEVFYVCDDTWLRPFPSIAQTSKLILARPDRMRHVVKDGVLHGWQYRDQSGKSYDLLPEQVLHIKNWNPYDEWRGLGELEAARIAAEADYLAGKFSLNLMRNNGDRGPYLVAKTGIPTDGQKDQIIAALTDKRRLSQRGEYKPVFLTGDISVEDPKVQVPDAAFLANRIQNRHEIYIAFGVPPSMADITVAYSIGSASDSYRLIQNTCMPTGEKLVDGIEQLVRKQTGQNLYVRMNWDEHPVMQEVRSERMESVEKLWTKGMPMEKINEFLQLGMPKFPGWDVGYLPFSVAPVNEHQAPETDPAFADQTPTPTDEGGKSTYEELIRTIAGRASSKDSAQWQEHMRLRRPAMKNYETKFRKELAKARKEVLKNIDQNFSRSIETKAAAQDFMFDLDAFSDGLLGAMRNAGQFAFNEAGQQLMKELGNDDPFQFAPEEVLDFVKNRQNKLKDVPQSIFDNIKGTLQDGLDQGDTQSELAARVREKFNGISKDRAQTIAQTETSAAYGTGRQVAMKKAGVKKKKWLTSGNKNVRASHRAANGQVVDVDKTYLVGGESLKHPGDPNGSAENVINCHCVSIAVKK